MTSPRRFYQCTNAGTTGDYVIYRNDCPAGLLFSDEDLVCENPGDVDCHGRPIPDGITTPKPVTTTTSDGNPPPTTSKVDTTTTTPAGPTTPKVTTTTTRPSTGGPVRYPDKVMGMYILLADDTEEGYGTNADWEPQLYEYQQEGSNVLFFTFINPATMEIPKAFEKLSASRGTGLPGAVPEDTVIMFAVGGFQYSIDPNPWDWLTSQSKAEAMAEQVATWPDRYNVEGIDLDIEDGAGTQSVAGTNMLHFIRRLRQLRPDFIIGQPAYGYPQVPAETEVINASWNKGQTSNNLADSVGLMVYEGTQALNYVENYAHGSQQWEGFPITVDVPYKQILLGCKGSSSYNDIITLAQEAVRQDLLGIMVWYVSAVDGFQYDRSWDALENTGSQSGYIDALQLFGVSKK